MTPCSIIIPLLNVEDAPPNQSLQKPEVPDQEHDFALCGENHESKESEEADKVHHEDGREDEKEFA